MAAKMKMAVVTVLSIFFSIAFMPGMLNALRMNKKPQQKPGRGTNNTNQNTKQAPLVVG